MASLYRKTVMLTDRASGEKVKSRSKKWWGQYKDAEGRLRRLPLATDKLAARAMLDRIVRQVEREKAGLVDPTDAQTAAIEALPAPPSVKMDEDDGGEVGLGLVG